MEKDDFITFSGYNGSKVLCVKHGLFPTLIYIYAKIKEIEKIHNTNLAIDVAQTFSVEKVDLIRHLLQEGFISFKNVSGIFIPKKDSPHVFTKISLDLKLSEHVILFKDGYGGKSIQYDEVTKNGVAIIASVFYPVRIKCTAIEVKDALEKFDNLDTISEVYYGNKN